MSSSTFESPDVKQHRALVAWWTYGDHVATHCQVRDSIHEEVHGAFDELVLWGFIDSVIAQLPDERRNGAAIGRMIGAGESTPTRWLYPDPKKRKLPDIRNFLFLVIASGGLPSIHDVVLESYRRTFEDVGPALKQPCRLKACEAASLYHVVRSWDWLVAMRTQSATLQNEAASKILTDTSDIFTGENEIRDAKNIRELLERCMRPWAVIESVLRYEWFG